MENETKSGGMGGLMGAIIIIILLIIGGWYFISNRVEKIQTQNQAAPVGDIVTGTSTEVADIEADLKNINLDSLNQP